jgi:hypothetical protein
LCYGPFREGDGQGGERERARERERERESFRFGCTIMGYRYGFGIELNGYIHCVQPSPTVIRFAGTEQLLEKYKYV